MSRAGTIFWGTLITVTLFIAVTSAQLPAVVASHFGAAGQANGFMPRAAYTRFMLAVALLVPAAIVVLSGWSLRGARLRINLPHRDYWLARERRADTLRAIREQMTATATLLAVFLAYVHWLVLRANTVLPARLPNAYFIGGLVVFVVLMLGSGLRLVRRFARLPDESR